MKLSIDDFKQKNLLNNSIDALDMAEAIKYEEGWFLRGGDKEYNPPLYEQKSHSFWQRATVLLDNIK